MATRWWTWRWWRRLFGLAARPADLYLALRILLLAAAVPWLMRLRLPHLAPWLTPKAMPSAPDATQIDKIIRYTDQALAVGQPLVQAKCLTRGITLYYFLRRAGLAVSLCFGIGELNGRFAGHCWLVKDGAPFSEPADPTVVYTPIHVLPAPASPHPAAPIAHARGR